MDVIDCKDQSGPVAKGRYSSGTCVMAGLVPAIHAVDITSMRAGKTFHHWPRLHLAPFDACLAAALRDGVDGRDKPGHDGRLLARMKKQELQIQFPA